MKTISGLVTYFNLQYLLPSTLYTYCVRSNSTRAIIFIGFDYIHASQPFFSKQSDTSSYEKSLTHRQIDKCSLYNSLLKQFVSISYPRFS